MILRKGHRLRVFHKWQVCRVLHRSLNFHWQWQQQGSNCWSLGSVLVSLFCEENAAYFEVQMITQKKTWRSATTKAFYFLLTHPSCFCHHSQMCNRCLLLLLFLAT
ncbi:hypothetical protein V6N13_065461 [Hibiscus sabdariffa]